MTSLKLVIEALSVARGHRYVLHNLTFAVGAGEALVLTGSNGVGKTTLIRTIAGLIRPASGRIDFQGGSPDLDLAEQCHMVGHLNAVKATLTVEENVAFWAQFLDGASPKWLAHTTIPAALERMGLADIADLPAGYLSAGQRRRLALARLLVAKRPVWLLDEPTVSLDAASRDILSGIIRDHVAGKGIVIAATHVPLGLEGARELKLAPRPPGIAEAAA
jgi:heme exporter protein A